MRTARIWQSRINWNQNGEVVRRTNSHELICGSHPRAHIRVPAPAPETVFTITRIEEADRVLLCLQTHNPEVEILNGDKWEAVTEFRGETLPKIRFQSLEVSVDETADTRSRLAFEPERWASEARELDPDHYAFWHLRDGSLFEAALISKGKPTEFLKSGCSIDWNPENPLKIRLIEYDGVSRTLDMVEGRHGASRVVMDNNVFIVTRVPDKKQFAALKPKVEVKEKDRFTQIVMAAGATWLLLMSLLNFVPATPVNEEPQLENLSADVAKIILEAPKAVDGGNGQRGGGGNEFTQNNDPRGGSGMESQNIQASAGPDEIQIKDKGALAVLSVAEKVIGTGVMKALEATGKIANALSALDEGVKSGKIRAAGLTGFGVGGKGSSKGVLGALSSLGGGGSGGGGTGIGGVGTKGFGGGGGGGTGSGFGTGTGAGLGKGEGLRTVAFDSENVNVRGGLERSEVEAVIQENISQIRFCYNRGLRSNPSLTGKVTTSFTIGGTGTVKVSRIANSTLGTSEVEGCIRERVASWKFPEPRGGGEVVVNYPFLFKSN